MLISDRVNGTTFGQSAKNAEALGIPFPTVPDSATFVNLGLNQYPVSYNARSYSAASLSIAPLIIR